MFCAAVGSGGRSPGKPAYPKTAYASSPAQQGLVIQLDPALVSDVYFQELVGSLYSREPTVTSQMWVPDLSRDCG